MSGAEVVGLISGIVSIVDAIVKIHGATKDASGLPSTFRDVIQKLPLLKDTLLAAQQGMDDGASDDSYAELKRVLGSCKEKADLLEKTFRTVKIDRDSSRAERYISAFRTLGKGRHVEELMDRILADMQLLTANYAIKGATKAQVKDLVMEMRNYENESKSDYSSSISNYGTGSQNIHRGPGSQNINTGSGPQLCGSFTGPFTFSSPVR
jgi:hypothetical protein